jgi:hypothetical protein
VSGGRCSLMPDCGLYRAHRLFSEQRRGWSLMIFCARAMCNLRTMRGSRQTVLLARRAPTMKQWSLDARSREQSAYSLWESSRIRRPSLGWAGEKVARSRSWSAHPPPRYELGKRRKMTEKNYRYPNERMVSQPGHPFAPGARASEGPRSTAAVGITLAARPERVTGGET